MTSNRRLALLVLCIGATLALVACGTTEPSDPIASDGSSSFNGEIDPTDETFLLKRITGPGLNVDLVGSNLRIDPVEEHVILDVAVHNRTDRPMFAPARVTVGAFVPSAVFPVNVDERIANVPENPIQWYGYYDYTMQLGDDGMLGPGETSDTRTWIFSSPGLQAFSFAAFAEFSMDPNRGRISGVAFQDENRNGVRDANEPPQPAISIRLTGPGGQAQSTLVNPNGEYAFFVDSPGLYSLRAEALLLSPLPVCYTTPNPLEVVVPPTSTTGDLAGNFDDADFGVVIGCDFEPLPAIELTERELSEFPQDQYDLLGFELVGDVFHVKAAFSGCGPDIPMRLVASKHLMESNPPQTFMILSVFNPGPDCDAHWQRNLRFDMSPLRELLTSASGEVGRLILRFIDHAGNEHRIEYGG